MSMANLKTVADVAKILRVSPKTVNKLVGEHRLRCVHIGRKTRRFRDEDIEEFLNRQAGTLSKQVDNKSPKPLSCKQKGGKEKSVEDYGTDLLGKEIRELWR